jgi:hypothetical protein
MNFGEAAHFLAAAAPRNVASKFGFLPSEVGCRDPRVGPTEFKRVIIAVFRCWRGVQCYRAIYSLKVAPCSPDLWTRSLSPGNPRKRAEKICGFFCAIKFIDHKNFSYCLLFSAQLNLILIYNLLIGSYDATGRPHIY